MDCCVGFFIWNGQIHTSPFCPKGGLALPNFQVYYWVVVFVRTYWWFEGSRSNVAVCVEAACLGSLLDLQNLVYRSMGEYAAVLGPTRVTLRVWAVVRRLFFQAARWPLVQPPWGTPKLAHFRLLLDPQVWARNGIRTLRDIMPEGILLTFP